MKEIPIFHLYFRLGKVDYNAPSYLDDILVSVFTMGKSINSSEEAVFAVISTHGDVFFLPPLLASVLEVRYLAEKADTLHTNLGLQRFQPSHQALERHWRPLKQVPLCLRFETGLILDHI